jgi:hypothetical protein
VGGDCLVKSLSCCFQRQTEQLFRVQTVVTQCSMHYQAASPESRSGEAECLAALVTCQDAARDDAVPRVPQCYDAKTLTEVSRMLPPPTSPTSEARTTTSTPPSRPPWPTNALSTRGTRSPILGARRSRPRPSAQSSRVSRTRSGSRMSAPWASSPGREA